jgi:phenylalanyl-tRNA synthetase alpha chain
MKDLEAKLGKDVAKVGQSKLAKKVKFNKGEGGVTIEKQDDAFEDTVQRHLQEISKLPSLEEAPVTAALSKAVVDDLKKRKMVSLGTVSYYAVTKGPKFALQRQKEATEITKEMLADGSWANVPFKAYNFNSLGKQPDGGHLHPLLKLRQEYREIFLELGFEEMTTNQWVESSFWCFDTLFVPQQHPARDMQDTFFLSDPAATTKHPEDYLKRVSDTHENGYKCAFSVPETQKNVLRTHTTACSARTLYRLAQTGFKPGKYFSIDRVFRNEEMDKTHLCEFHQIEGFVIDYNLSLANMMQVLEQFFLKIGVNQLRFKPAYNPYTEPSMEVFGYHEGLDKWMEVGNSGVFRPEMLQPMGLPEGVTAIAWGLSLERPAMMKYALNNIHKLVGHDVDLAFVKNTGICRVQA